MHRQILLDAAQKYKPTWLFYSDCDERFEGNIKEFILSTRSRNIQGIKVSLFDAYMTCEDKKPYKNGELYNFRKYFGPEVRNILMIWRNNSEVKFLGLNQRQPKVGGKVITKFFCQHYGKSLSIDHWEETCDYYAKYFTKYKNKWLKRKGKAIHKKSDFGRKLYTWENVKKYSIPINKISLFFRLWKKIRQILFK